jgi:hypothetical protein
LRRLHATDDADYRRKNAHGGAGNCFRRALGRKRAGIAGAGRRFVGSKTLICPSNWIAAPETSGTRCRTHAALMAWRVVKLSLQSSTTSACGVCVVEQRGIRALLQGLPARSSGLIRPALACG